MRIPTGFEWVHAGRVAMLVRADGRDWLVPLLLAAARGEPTATGRALGGGRGGTAVVRLQGHEVVLRPYRRGGVPARLLRDRYFGCSPRPLRELCLLEQLRGRGAPVVEPLGACVHRIGPASYRGWIVTRYISEARTVWEWVASGATPNGERAAVWRRVGAALRRLHGAGARHPDLNLQNILVFAEAGALHVAFIDFDHPRFSGLFRRPSADLARLRRSARKLDPDGRHVTDGDLEQVRTAYDAGAHG